MSNVPPTGPLGTGSAAYGTGEAHYEGEHQPTLLEKVKANVPGTAEYQEAQAGGGNVQQERTGQQPTLVEKVKAAIPGTAEYQERQEARDITGQPTAGERTREHVPGTLEHRTREADPYQATTAEKVKSHVPGTQEHRLHEGRSPGGAAGDLSALPGGAEHGGRLASEYAYPTEAKVKTHTPGEALREGERRTGTALHETKAHIPGTHEHSEHVVNPTQETMAQKVLKHVPGTEEHKAHADVPYEKSAADRIADKSPLAGYGTPAEHGRVDHTHGAGATGGYGTGQQPTLVEKVKTAIPGTKEHAAKKEVEGHMGVPAGPAAYETGVPAAHHGTTTTGTAGHTAGRGI